ncbi:hypothetical protein [Niallia taxi]|uniref:hypothetical protein n=1 Tax=Niallia taxi TaxID=2499688 RepID=UPI002550F1D5|nr:hypothetical protein [Niallia taxi]MDK8641313.1 hypothetical protein [Niallia taxi]
MAKKVTLPLDVYNAFENLRFAWGKIIPPEDFNSILLNINNIGRVVGDAEVLKKYAQENPTKYIRAIANGYKVVEESDLVIQVHERLERWMDKPYEGEESEDLMEFAKEITGFIRKLLAV